MISSEHVSFLHQQVWNCLLMLASILTFNLLLVGSRYLTIIHMGSSHHQQTSGDNPLLCLLQQHGTTCYQTSEIFSHWGLSNPDSRLICLTVTNMTRHHSILRYNDNLCPCNGCWCSTLLQRIRNYWFIIIIIIISLLRVHYSCFILFK